MGDQTFGQPGVLGAEGGRVGDRGSGGVWGSGADVALKSGLRVSEAACTEDASVVCRAGVDICKMGALAKFISLRSSSSQMSVWC